jgi:hypothetical protein
MGIMVIETKRASVQPDANNSTLNPPTVAAASATTNPPEPDFLRLPRHGQRCPRTGLSRAFLYDLVRTRTVKAQILRKPGALRGVVLISWPSLKAYLNSEMDKPIPGGRKAA